MEKKDPKKGGAPKLKVPPKMSVKAPIKQIRIPQKKG
jgi:hypothetical protein